MFSRSKQQGNKKVHFLLLLEILNGFDETIDLPNQSSIREIAAESFLERLEISTSFISARAELSGKIKSRTTTEI